MSREDAVQKRPHLFDVFQSLDRLCFSSDRSPAPSCVAAGESAGEAGKMISAMEKGEKNTRKKLG
jgi:hypothetical protein